MYQTAPAHKEVSGQQSERGQDANLVRRVHLRDHRHCLKRTSIECLALHFVTDLIGLGIQKTEVFSALQHDRNLIDNAKNGNQLHLFNF
jgi:hypothetical protein